ncbi:BNR-4 repeat-containing protein [Pelagicoccus sp. NFK12]|uniref:BNR-4 repeat-containing protein n=1 Tax=Pelagicoccus enzymogenes TaxID=2773457 RepID=A0A927FAX2_9BACT|nr:BNR-4 repeat-containing protein [Pelagicoccus enzymogenes]MBD5780093.1 BNR-4 repeat-containing protein [Pelagicoccus enzymogenes]
MIRFSSTFSIPALTLACFALAACSDKPAKVPAANENQVDYFADDAWGNPLAVVQHPAGEHVDGITYLAYQGPLEDPYVASYNHETGEWKGPVQAGVSVMGKDPNRAKKVDNHGKPTLIVDDAGYIHVFYGGHGGTPGAHGENPLGNHHYGENRHAVSKRPYDITEWEDLHTIPPFGTYNQAVKMDNGDLYLFYRHGAHRSDWVYHKSTDNGRTFSPAVSFLKHKRRDDLDAVDSWYAWVGRGKGDEIIVTYDYHLCWDMNAGVDGRGHTTERHDAYYMVFNTKTGVWTNVQGEELQMPITREYADEMTLAARTGDKWTFNGTVHLDSEGHPHIATNIGEDLGEKTGGPKRTSHFRWTGEEWVGGEPVADIAPDVDSRGDFIVNSPQDIRFLIAYKEDGIGQVAWWNSLDGGASFTKGREVLRRENAGWAITSIIRNSTPEARAIVAEKQPGEDWHRVYLLGDDGPVTRALSEAQRREK